MRSFQGVTLGVNHISECHENDEQEHCQHIFETRLFCQRSLLEATIITAFEAGQAIY